MRDEEEEYNIGRMAQNIKVIGEMIWLMEKEDWFILMEIFILANGRMIKQMGLEYIWMQMGRDTKENGKKINKMEKENNFELMVADMKEFIKTELSKEKGFFIGKTVHIFKVTL